MAELWANADEVTAAAKCSPRNLRRKVRAGEIKWRASGAKAANGRAQREFLANSLPNDVQKKIVLRRAAIARRDAAETSGETSQLSLFQREPVSKDALRIVLPSAKAQAQAEHRLEAIRPLLEYLQLTTPAEREQWCAQNGLSVENANDLARQIASKENRGRSTIWCWAQRFRKDAFPALANRIRKDKGQSRWFAEHRQAAILAAYLYLGDIDRKDLKACEMPHRGQSVAFVHKQICESAESLGIGAGDLPSYETVRLFLSDAISPAMKTLAREGQREYRERMAPYLRRRYDDIFSNQIWIGDQLIHDVEVANDLFDEEPPGAPIRLRMDAFEDYRSRKVVGVTWTRFGSSRSIAASLRRAILQFGPCELIYVDNGRDYKKIAHGAQRGFPIETLRSEDLAPIERTGFLARIGVGVVHCLPRHPQSKGIERCFGTLHHFDAFWSTYTSGSPATRPDATEAAMVEHRRLFKRGRVAESKHPLASAFVLACLAWIDEYNATAHSGEGMEGRTPNEVFAAEFNPAQRPVPESSALALLMAEHTQRRVRECAVTLDKRRYLPRGEDRLAWAAMHNLNEREILVAYDPADPECAAALDLDGRFVAWLEAEHLMRFAPSDPQTQARIGESMANRRGLEKAVKGTLREIARAARSAGAQSAEEMILSRIQIPAAAGELVTQRRPRLTAGRPVEAPATPDEVAREILAMKA